MRIENSTVDSRIQGGAGAVDALGSESRAAAAGRNGSGTDTVTLSGADSWVALAKQSFSVSQQQKVDRLSAQIHAGKYQTDVAQISHAVVGGHIRE